METTVRVKNKLLVGDQDKPVFEFSELHDSKSEFDFKSWKIMAIYKLRTIRVLDLSSNGLEFLPESFGETLISLKTLFLDHNNLTSLPESIKNLYSLKTLWLNHNELESLSESFGWFFCLKTLHLSHNKLESLPESFGNLFSLRMLRLDNNKLKFLPKSFGKLFSLQFLNLAGNKLESLPESFGNLPFLRELFLDRNKLTSEGLPSSFENLKRSLQKLHLDCSKFTSFTKIYFASSVFTSLEMVNDDQLPKHKIKYFS